MSSLRRVAGRPISPRRLRLVQEAFVIQSGGSGRGLIFLRRFTRLGQLEVPVPDHGPKRWLHSTRGARARRLLEGVDSILSLSLVVVDLSQEQGCLDTGRR